MTTGVIHLERFRFHVQSRGRSNLKHLVDLEALGWNGQCGCEAFIACRKRWLAAGKESSARTRCWHVERARSFFIETYGPLLSAAMDKPHPMQRTGRPVEDPNEVPW